MKKLYISLFALITSLLSLSYAQEATNYGKILYRVDIGGHTLDAYNDTTDLQWTYDNYTDPNQYIDTVAMGRSFYLTTNAVTLGSSVPSYVPPVLFTQERSLGKPASALEYNFTQIPANKKVEVRLYFAEIYFTEVNKRKFDIVIEGQTKQANLDIFAEAGKNVGIMKSYVVTVSSDGNLDVDFKKVTGSPNISGIEIIEIQDAVVQGLFTATKKSNSIEAYPNPVNNSVHIDFGALNAESLKLYDSFGREVSITYNQVGTKADVNMDGLLKGIYYLHAVTSENKTETVRLIKE